MLMLILSIGYVSAQGKADIKFDKTTHDFGTFSENNPIVNCVFTFTNVGDGNPSSCSFLRMYSSRIHSRARTAGEDGNHQNHLQRYRQISGTLQEIHHPAYKCQNRNDAALCRRRNDGKRREISIFSMIRRRRIFQFSFFFVFFESFFTRRIIIYKKPNKKT